MYRYTQPCIFLGFSDVHNRKNCNGWIAEFVIDFNKYVLDHLCSFLLQVYQLVKDVKSSALSVKHKSFKKWPSSGHIFHKSDYMYWQVYWQVILTDHHYKINLTTVIFCGFVFLNVYWILADTDLWVGWWSSEQRGN